MSGRDTVLVVDDMPATLGMLATALEEAGYSVLVAQSAASALSIVERITPDAILLDAIMPQTDGFVLCRMLKNIPALTAVPVIFMTGLTESADVVRGLEAGGVDYVTKPLRLDEAVARVGVHIATSRLTRNARRALDLAGRYLFAADADGRIIWATPQASSSMPAAERSAAWLRRCWIAVPSAPLVLAAPDGRGVEIHHVGETEPGEKLFRIVPMSAGCDEAVLRGRFGLTAREAEVLAWLGRGKSNRDIADILSMSHRTVAKHLEEVFRKIGVENRTAAASLAVRVISERSIDR